MTKVKLEEKALESLAFELDGELMGVKCRLITLEDARVALGHLREDMDNVKPEDAKYFFHEFHRTVRMLDDLIRYTMDDTNRCFEKVESIGSEIFDKTRREAQ